MRSSLFGFIELILLIGLILFYRIFPEITIRRRKANLEKISAGNFTSQSLLSDPNEVKRSENAAWCERSEQVAEGHC